MVVFKEKQEKGDEEWGSWLFLFHGVVTVWAVWVSGILSSD